MFVPIIADGESYNLYVKHVQNALGINADKLKFERVPKKNQFYNKHIRIIKNSIDLGDDADIIYVMNSNKYSLYYDTIRQNWFSIDFKTGLGCELPIISISPQVSSLFQNNRIVIGLDHPSHNIAIKNKSFKCEHAVSKNTILLRMDKYIFEIILNPSVYEYFVNWRNGVCRMRITPTYTCSADKSKSMIEYLLKCLVNYMNGDMEQLSQEEIGEVNHKILLCLNFDKLTKILQTPDKKIKLYGGLALIYSDLYNDIGSIYTNYEKIKKLIEAGSAIKGIKVCDKLKHFFNISDYEKKWKLHYNIKYHKHYSSYKDELTLNAIRQSNINSLVQLITHSKY